MRRIWLWCKTALLGDDLYVRVVAGFCGASMLVGCAFLLQVASGADIAAANPWFVGVGVFLFLAFLVMGTTLTAAAFLPPTSRLWRWSERIDPTSGASALDEVAILLVLLVVVLAVLIPPTLLLRACGINGYGWGPVERGKRVAANS